MSRQRRAVDRALAAKGYGSRDVTWETPYGMVEMQGPEGGWELDVVDRDGYFVDHLSGLNLDMVLEQIDYLVPADEQQQGEPA